MKTTTIELNENDYKKLKRKVDKHKLTVGDYVMRLFRNRGTIAPGLALDEAIDDTFDACDNISEVEDTLRDIESIARMKMQDTIEYLEKQEEL